MGNRMHLNPSDTTELLDLHLDRSVPENRTVDVLTVCFYIHKLIYLLISLEDDTSTRPAPKQVMYNKSFGLKIVCDLDVLRQ